METLVDIGRLLSGAMKLKAETDYWNTHSDSYKATIWAQIFLGMAVAGFAYWSYRHHPVGTANSTVPILFFLDYVCICYALNSQRNLNEKSFASENFSEFWLFGFFKGDDFMAGIVIGWLGAALFSYGIFSSLVLHQTISIGDGPSAPAVVHSAPVPTSVVHASHKVHSGAPASSGKGHRAHPAAAK